MKRIIAAVSLLVTAFILLSTGAAYSLQTDSTGTYAEYIVKGNEYIRLGQWDPAIEQFKMALEKKESAEANGGIARANFGKAQIKYERVVPWREVRKLHYENEAEEYFKKAMTLDPDNPDWAYELSILLIYKGSDFDLEAAAELLENIRAADADFKNSAFLLAEVYERLQKMDRAEELYETVTDGSLNTRIVLRKALSAASQDSLGKAEEFYRRAIDGMDKNSEEAVLEMTGMLFSAEDAGEYRAAENHAAFLNEFWLTRDPTPRTAENERIQEHLRRIVYARKHFASPGSQRSYDDRGKIYIKYGDPSYRYQSSGDTQTFRNESWTYDYEIGSNRDGLVFDFANVAGYGFVIVQDLREAFMGGAAPIGQLAAMYRDRADVNYAYYGLIGYGSWDVHDFATRLRDLAVKKNEAYKAAPAELYIHKDYPANRIPMNISQASFRGEGGETRYEIYYAFPLDALQYRTVKEVKTNSLNQEITVRRQADDEIISEIRRIDFEFQKKKSLKNEWHVSQINLNLPVYAGAPVAHLMLQDPVNNQMSLAYCKLSNRDYSGGGLMISDMKFSYNIGPSREDNPFTRNGLRVIPVVSGTLEKKKPVQVYFEVYNLTPGPSGETSYKIQYIVRSITEGADRGFAFFDSAGELILPPRDEDKNEYISLESTASSPVEKEANYLSVDLAKLEEGEYEFLVNVVDLNTNRHAYSLKTIRLVDR